MVGVDKLSATLVPIRLEDVRQRQAVLDHTARSPDLNRIYIALQGPTACQPPTPAVLDALVHCFESSAVLKPQLDVVPLLPCVGWDSAAISTLTDVRSVTAARADEETAIALLTDINTHGRRSQSLEPELHLTVVDNNPSSIQQQSPSANSNNNKNKNDDLQPGSRVLGDWQGPLEFGTVAVGGTFDRFHAGHRLLLAATALVTRKHIFVGITDDKLLANKKGAELLQSYDTRAASAVDYMQRINPHITVTAGALNDPAVPPLCAIERDFQAIVVSEETIHGADAINEVRAKLGFPPLVVVVVGLIASQQRSVKLSSTDLRMMEVAGRSSTR